MSTRYGATRAAYTELARGTRRAPLPRRPGVGGADDAAPPPGAVTNLPADLRAALVEDFPLALRPLVEQRGDGGDTTKWLFATVDGHEIETVLMVSPDRATVCVSSQAGCAMGCTFCATGQAGFDRHLDPGEIVEQVAHAMHHAARPVTNVVFMGMGEPLANFGPTWEAVDAPARRLRHLGPPDHGVDRRHRPRDAPHGRRGAPRDARRVAPRTRTTRCRDTMIPINARYPLREVIGAAHAVARRHGRRVTFEYACIEGVNDAPELADELAELLAPLGPLGTHVNLIPLNPTAGFGGRAADRSAHPGLRRPPRRRRAHTDDPAQPGHRHRRRLRAAPGAGEPGPWTPSTRMHR